MLLTILAEECSEIAHRASKAIRFGMDEVQPDQPDKGNNAARMMDEFNDLFAVIEVLYEEDLIPHILDRKQIIAKKEKVKHFMQYSKERGMLTEKEETNG